MAAKRKRKPNLKAFLIAGIVMALIVFAAVASWLSRRIKPNPPGTVGNTSGNLNNRGLFVEDGNEIYFINTYDHNYIYKMRLDGTDASLFMDVSASYLNSAGDYIYFNQENSGGETAFGLAGSIHGVYRKKKTGDKITNGIERAVAGVLVLIDNTLVFQTGDSELGTTLQRAGIDGSNKQMVCEAYINPSCVINGTIYFPDYNNNHYLSVLNPLTGVTQLYIKERVHNPTYQNGYIYYMSVDNNYSLYRYNMSANTIERLTDDRVDTFNINGDHIYYQKNSATEPMLIRMRANGEAKEIVANGYFTDINTTSYYTYFRDFTEPEKMYRVANGEGSMAERFIP